MYQKKSKQRARENQTFKEQESVKKRAKENPYVLECERIKKQKIRQEKKSMMI